MKLGLIKAKKYVGELESLMHEYCIKGKDVDMLLVEEVIKMRNLIYQSCSSLMVMTPIGELPIDIAKQYVSYVQGYVDLTKDNNLKLQVDNLKTELLDLNLNTMIECNLKYDYIL